MSHQKQTGTLELLLFRLGGRQIYGINVFKVQEVLPCPALTEVPDAHPHVKGIATLRGRTIPVFDLCAAIGLGPLRIAGVPYVIVTEFSRTMHGMQVERVDKIVQVAWEKVLPPPAGSGRNSFLTAVTEVDGHLVEIIDVERVLNNVTRVATRVDDSLKARGELEVPAGTRVMVVDDSSVARHQIANALEQIGVECDMFDDGAEALEGLRALQAQGKAAERHYLMVISDIEMPRMNGYALTKAMRADADLRDIYVLLHSSISGHFNDEMVSQAGADKFIPKYNPDDLAAAVLKRVHDRALAA